MDAQLWIDGIRDALQTESARTLLTALEEADANEWWKRVCGFVPKRTKPGGHTPKP